jgi:prolyl oligopeptidase
VLVNILDNVTEPARSGSATPHGRFARRAVDAPSPGNAGRDAACTTRCRRDDPLAEQYLLSYTDFLTPDSLLLGRSRRRRRDTLKSLPASFDSVGMRAEQHFATSRDGTRVPYFVVWPRGAKPTATTRRCCTATAASRSRWSPGTRRLRRAWYQRGGVLVVANIRGGGEFGPPGTRPR